MSSPSITTPAPAYEARTVTETTTGLELFGDDKTVVAVRVNGVIQDLHLAIDPSTGSGSAEVEPVSIESDEGLAILRHSTAHVLAQAVQAGHSDAKLGIGPPITDGFYYDFDVAEPFTPEDLKNLEKAMIRIVKERQRFRRRVVSDEEAREELAAEPYKLELIADKGAIGPSTGSGHDPSTGSGTTLRQAQGTRMWKWARASSPSTTTCAATTRSPGGIFAVARTCRTPATSRPSP